MMNLFALFIETIWRVTMGLISGKLWNNAEDEQRRNREERERARIKAGEPEVTVGDMFNKWFR